MPWSDAIGSSPQTSLFVCLRYAERMLSKLPGWVVEDAQSVREEVADWIDLTPAERWQLAKLCARDAAWAAAASGRREQILAHEDPLPASTLAALERLRKRANWGDAGR